MTPATSRWSIIAGPFLLSAIALGVVGALGGPWRVQTQLAYRFSPGQKNVYKLTYNNIANADLSALMEKTNTGPEQTQPGFGLIQSFKMSVRSDLVVTVVKKSDPDFVISYNLRNPVVELEVSGKRAPDQEAMLERDLEQVVFANVDVHGRIRSLRFDTEVQSASQNLIRALLGATQAVTPEQVIKTDTWEVQEEDSFGRYVARYQLQPTGGRESSPDCRAIRKSKLSYVVSNKRPTSEPQPLTPSVKPDTNLLICFDANGGQLRSVKGTDKEVSMMLGQIVGSSDTNISLDLVGVETISDENLRALSNANAISEKTTSAVALSAMPTLEDIKRMTRRNTLGDATLESLLNQLASQESVGGKEETALYLKFRALVYVRPETCEPLGKILAKAPSGSLTFRVLADALAEVGSPQTQEALVGTIRLRSGDRPALLKLIPLLGLAENPTTPTENVLRDLAFKSEDATIGSTAQLALGNIVKRLAEASPERANKILDLILDKIGAASSDEEINQLLLVVGNTGAGRALQLVASFLSHSSAQVRANAALALRFMVSDQTDPLLIKALSADSDPGVRRAAAYALSFRAMTTATFAAEKAALLKDQDEDVRLVLLTNLWGARDGFPEVRSLVRKIADEDASERVRKKAAELNQRRVTE